MRTSKINEHIANQLPSAAGRRCRAALSLILVLGAGTAVSAAADDRSAATAHAGEVALRLTTDLTADTARAAGQRASSPPAVQVVARPASLILPADSARVVPLATGAGVPRWLAALLLSLCGFALGAIAVWRLNRHVIRQVRLSSAMEVKGRRRDYEFVLEKVEDKLQLREAQVKALNAQARDYAAREHAHNEELKALRHGQKQTATLRAELADYVRELNASRAMQSRLQAEVRDAQARLKPADAQLERQKKLIRQLSADLDEADMTVFNLREQVEYLQSHNEPPTRPTAADAPVPAASRIAHLVSFGQAEAASLARGSVPEALDVVDQESLDVPLMAESHEQADADTAHAQNPSVDPGTHT